MPMSTCSSNSTHHLSTSSTFHNAGAKALPKSQNCASSGWHCRRTASIHACARTRFRLELKCSTLAPAAGARSKEQHPILILLLRLLAPHRKNVQVQLQQLPDARGRRIRLEQLLEDSPGATSGSSSPAKPSKMPGGTSPEAQRGKSPRMHSGRLFTWPRRRLGGSRAPGSPHASLSTSSSLCSAWLWLPSA